MTDDLLRKKKVRRNRNLYKNKRFIQYLYGFVTVYHSKYLFINFDSINKIKSNKETKSTQLILK